MIIPDKVERMALECRHESDVPPQKAKPCVCPSNLARSFRLINCGRNNYDCVQTPLATMTIIVIIIIRSSDPIFRYALLSLFSCYRQSSDGRPVRLGLLVERFESFSLRVSRIFPSAAAKRRGGEEERARR